MRKPRAGGRRAETVPRKSDQRFSSLSLARQLPRLKSAEAFDEYKGAGLLASTLSYFLRLTTQPQYEKSDEFTRYLPLGLGGGIIGGLVRRYSGATARVLHPVPYSPKIIILGTPSCHDPIYWAFSQRTTQDIGLYSDFSQELAIDSISFFYIFLRCPSGFTIDSRTSFCQCEDDRSLRSVRLVGPAPIACALLFLLEPYHLGH
jgi:hypothetical protein